MHRLSSKVVVITGSSSGLGRAIALAFAAEDAKLIVCADLSPTPRSAATSDGAEPTHERICRRWGAEKAVFIKTDVTVAREVEAAVQEAVSKGGALHVMVNNAGVGPEHKLIHELEPEKFEEIMNINAYGPFLGCKYACLQFVKQRLHSRGHRGWIINVASAAGLVGARNSAAYCASKGALVNFTRAVALDYADFKIHVNALCPGVHSTAMTENLFQTEHNKAFIKASTPWWNDGNVEDVAKAAVFLASEDAAWVTGVPLPVDGGTVAQ